MPVPVDPYPDFRNSIDIADGDQVDARFKALYDTLNPAVVGVDSANIKDASVADADLASPSNGVWRTLFENPFSATSVLVLGSYFTPGPYGVLAAHNTGQPAAQAPVPFFYDPADYAVAGKAIRLRLVATVLTNATPPGGSLNFTAHQVNAAGGGANQGLAQLVTPELVVATLAAPGASARLQVPSAEFTVGATWLAFGAYIGGANQAPGSLVWGRMSLQMRHI